MHSIRNSRHLINFDAFGAQPLSWICTSFHTPVLWEMDKKYWNRTAPVLFPVVGRLKNDTYQYQGQKYPLKQHGFARDLEFDVSRNDLFEVSKEEAHSIGFLLSSNSETRKLYPFDFELHIAYTLEEDTLKVDHTVKNTSDSGVLPFSLGAHPGFHTPGLTNEYSVIVEGLEVADRHLIEDGIYSGETQELRDINGIELQLSDELFSSDAVVFKQKGISSMTILRNGDPRVKVSLDTPAPYWGIWKKMGAPFLCLEPWWGIADNRNSSGEILEKEGIVQLAAGESRTFAYNITHLA